MAALYAAPKKKVIALGERAMPTIVAGIRKIKTSFKICRDILATFPSCPIRREIVGSVLVARIRDGAYRTCITLSTIE